MDTNTNSVNSVNVKPNCSNEKLRAILAEMIAAGKGKTDWLVYMTGTFASTPKTGQSIDEYWVSRRASALSKLKTAKTEADKGDCEITKEIFQTRWDAYQFPRGRNVGSSSKEDDSEVAELKALVAAAKAKAEAEAKAKAEFAAQLESARLNSVETEKQILNMLAETPVV